MNTRFYENNTVSYFDITADDAEFIRNNNDNITEQQLANSEDNTQTSTSRKYITVGVSGLFTGELTDEEFDDIFNELDEITYGCKNFFRCSKDDGICAVFPLENRAHSYEAAIELLTEYNLNYHTYIWSEDVPAPPSADINHDNIISEAADAVCSAYQDSINCTQNYIQTAQELFAEKADGDSLRAAQLVFAQDIKSINGNLSTKIRELYKLVGDNLPIGFAEKRQALIDEMEAVEKKALAAHETIFNQRIIEALLKRFDKDARNNAMLDAAVTTEAQDVATDAEIQLANVKEDTEMTNINSNVTIDDNGQIFDTAKVTIEQAVDIIRRLNYRNDTFQYTLTTREDYADIKYRHFDAYRQNGDKDSFAISEIVINGKLEIVRFYNLFRDIIVDLHIGNLNYTLGYRGAIEIADVQSDNYNQLQPTTTNYNQLQPFPD